MKKILSLMVFALLASSLHAQVVYPPVYNKACLRYVGDNSRLHKCNQKQIYKDITRNIVYPEGITHRMNGGRVLVKILIETDGTFSIEIIKSSHHDFSVAVWNAFQKMNPWLLGATIGENKTQYVFMLPVSFAKGSTTPTPSSVSPKYSNITGMR
jgi:hypothetical protein